MSKVGYFISAMLLGTLQPYAAKATTVDCTIVKDVTNDQVIHQSGEKCETDVSPASTFKLPLALIGFDSGFLTSPTTPKIEYDPETYAPLKSWQQDTNPTMWLENSTVWYSWKITKHVGMTRFQSYVDAFDYGNRDLSGNPGRNNGLTQAWLSASLRISPEEQIQFLENVVEQGLPIDQKVYQKFFATVETFETREGQKLKGKTGTAWRLNERGNKTDDMHGWFIGWMEHKDTVYAFVRLTTEPSRTKGHASQRTKNSLLADLPNLLP